MKTKILLIASASILTAGIALHTIPHEPLCQKLFKSGKSETVKTEASTVVKK